MKRLLAIIGIAIVVVWVGAGCKTMPGRIEFDSPFFDLEYEGDKSE